MPPLSSLRIICFAGALYDQHAWTNRQHMMSRISEKYPVLYIEPRVWIVRFLVLNWRKPRVLISFFRRLFVYEKRGERLYVKAQWNLVPGSRENKAIASFNHYLNRYFVLFTARVLGFLPNETALWIYDTEAAEYLSAFPRAMVLYDCVDDHAAQAGVDRNPQRVEEEEKQILRRANVVTVTSRRLLEMKKSLNVNTHLVLNAGDVDLYAHPPASPSSSEQLQALTNIPHPILGTAGALDSYKVDFDLLYTVATTRPEWHFVFIGVPVVDQGRSLEETARLKKLPNVHMLGPVEHTQVPHYVKYFDICLIPYKANRYNEASFPLKFWEFMATGKPIVVHGLPELKEFESLIGYAESAQDFIDKCEYWLLNAHNENNEERKNSAAFHSWQRRVEEIMHLLEGEVTKRGV